MKRSLATLLAASVFACAGALSSAHADDKPLSKEEVEAIVKKVIQENPDLIVKSVQQFEEKDSVAKVSKAAQNMTKLGDKINHDPRSPTIGNPNGDVTVVEFFDYHCGFCKRFYPEISRLLTEDKNVRVVFKEFPILSPDSSDAARAALAVYHIDKSKYFDYHIRLMQSNNDFTEEVLAHAAKEGDIDEDTFKKAFADPSLQKDLDDNKQLAEDLSINGTPGLIIGSEVMPGAISYDKLKAAVDEVRDSQNQHKVIKKKED